MLKEQEKTTLDDEQEILEEKVFQEQCFLMDFYDEFMSNNLEPGPQPSPKKTYKHFTQIDTTDSVATMMSRLLGKGITRLMEIKPFELSLLQPRIRLFKTVYVGKEEKDIELRFDDSNKEGRFDNLRVGDVVRNRFQIGGGAGLKSFEWEDTGTNPGDSGKAFKAVIQMHFQNTKDFFFDRSSVKDQSISFADLVRFPPKRYTRRGTQNEKYFRIKVQVGWQVPPGKAAIIDDELRRSLENSVMTMFLSLTKHNLKYSQEGTLDVTAEYMGAIENKLLSAETDVLFIGADVKEQVQNLQNQLDNSQKNLEFQQEMEKRDKIKKQSRPLIAKIASFDITTSIGEAFADTPSEILEERIEETEEQREGLVKENKAKAYKRLLTSLEEQNRLFFIDIPAEEIELLGQARNDRKHFTRRVAARLRDQRRKDRRENTLPGGIEPDSWRNNSISEKEIRQIVKANGDEAKKRLADNVSKNISKTNAGKLPGSRRVNFVYFGDIVNAALSVVFFDKSQTEKLERKENEDFRFLLGSIEIIDSQTGAKKIRSLSDVPVSLDLFQTWFLKNVIRLAKNKYLLRDFLRDLCSELVLKALRPDCFGPSSKGVRNRVSFSVFSLPSNDDKEPIPKGTRVNLEDIKVSRKGSPDKMRHYLLMYVSGHAPDKLKGEFGKDTSNGIYHFLIGADRGLVKFIDFDKADIQYLPEARILDDEDVNKGDAFLSEPYNAKVVMWGNSIFKPGMLVYIDPKTLGMGNMKPKERLPLGGYYSVIKVSNQIKPGVFETELNLNWVSHGDEQEANRKVATGQFNAVTGQTELIDDVPQFLRR